MKVKDWIDRLSKEFDPEQEVCIHLWQAADVQHAAENMNKPVVLTDDQAQEVISTIERRIDSSMGVSWDTINWHTENYISNLPEEDEQE